MRGYLEFRSGQSWRPVTHRFHPEQEAYVHAVRVLLGAWYGNTWRGIPVGRSRLRATLAALERRRMVSPAPRRVAA